MQYVFYVNFYYVREGIEVYSNDDYNQVKSIRCMFSMTTMALILILATFANIAQVTSYKELRLYAPNATDGSRTNITDGKYTRNVTDGKERIRLGYMTGSENQEGDMFYQKPGQVISGAITYAVDQINANPELLPNHTLEFLIAETMGQETESIKLASVLPSYNISAYIGPQETCVHEGRIAAAFNLPMISYVSIVSFRYLLLYIST